MRKKLNVGFITTVSGRWPRELPNKRLVEYGEWLKENISFANIISFDTIIDSPERIDDAITKLKSEGVDLVISLYGAFTGDDVCTAVAESLKVPLIMWAPHEPELNGGRLLANALVALTMNCASMHRLGLKAHPVYGDKEEPEVAEAIITLVKAYSAVRQMNGSLIGLFGYRPTAFYNSAFDEGLIRRTFGVRIEETDLKIVFDKMEELKDDMVIPDRLYVKDRYSIIDGLPESHIDNHSRLYLALKELIPTFGYDISAIKCWPEMGNLNTTPCAVLGRLTDEGMPIACEGDMDATLTMMAETYITGKPSFVTDLSDIDEKENSLIFWHCGNAAPSLHKDVKETVLANHPLAGQGTAFKTTLKKGKVTIARFCNIHGKYKLLVFTGEAVDTDMYTPGCMVNVVTKAPVRDIIYGLIEEGVPHHYTITWDDVSSILKEMAKILNIEVIEY